MRSRSIGSGDTRDDFASDRASHYLSVMSFESPLSRLQPAERDAIRELDLVILAEAVRSDDGDLLSAGTVGTVVAIWAGGSGYEVEFEEPWGALATVMPSQIAGHRRYDS